MHYNKFCRMGGKEDFMEEKMHNITLEDRKRLVMTLCKEVLSFDENEIVMNVGDRSLVVKGKGLSVEEISRVTGDVIIVGDSIESMIYDSGKGKKEGLLRRMLK